MEWKEHVAFLAPIAATVVAFAVSYYGPTLAKKIGERRAVMIFFIVSFAAAAAAGLFGALITKAAPGFEKEYRMATKISSDKPNGPCRSIAGRRIGSPSWLDRVVLGLSESFGTALNWYNPVGPLSASQHLALRLLCRGILPPCGRIEINFSNISTAALVLLAIGLLGTFPPVWHIFSGG
jgi:hypothetical protein